VILKLPDLTGVYGDLSHYQNDIQVHGILKQIEKTDRVKGSFEEMTIFWFKKYALAASLLILAVSSLFYLTQPETTNGELSPDEMFYSYEQSSADDYVLYLDQWIDP
jgi:predicted membrane-bound mannosyltransferase